MKINEVVLRENPNNSKPHIPIGQRYYDKGNNYEWNGNLWINITQGNKSATKEQQAKLNAIFPQETPTGPEDDKPQGPQAPKVPDNITTGPGNTGVTKPKSGKWPDTPPTWGDGVDFDKYPPTLNFNGEMVPPPSRIGPKTAKIVFKYGGYVDISGTSAAGMTYKDFPPLKRVFVPFYSGKMKELLKGNSYFYVEDEQKILRLVDRTKKDGMKITKAIVNSLLKTTQKPGIVQRARDAMDDYFDPDSPDRSGYRVLQDPKANRNRLGVVGARVGDAIDSYMGWNKRKD